MLLLSFYIGAERYALPAKDIVEILPLTSLKNIPRAPDFIVGLLNYRGTPSPVIDLCILTEERDCNKVLSSRIIIINYIDAKDQPHKLGITAEKVTETININRSDFESSGIVVKDAPFLGEIANKDNNMIQFIEIKKLLPEHVQSILFQETTKRNNTEQ